MIDIQWETTWVSNSWHMHTTAYSERGNGSFGRLAFHPLLQYQRIATEQTEHRPFPTPHEALSGCVGVFVFWLGVGADSEEAKLG